MSDQSTNVAAIYPTEQAARLAAVRLKQRGFPRNRIYLVDGYSAGRFRPLADDPGMVTIDEMLTGLLDGPDSGQEDFPPAKGNCPTDSADQDVKLFLATPVRQTLSVAASCNSIRPTANGQCISIDHFIDIVREAVKRGHWTIVVRATEDAPESERAFETVRSLFG